MGIPKRRSKRNRDSCTGQVQRKRAKTRASNFQKFFLAFFGFVGAEMRSVKWVTAIGLGSRVGSSLFCLSFPFHSSPDLLELDSADRHAIEISKVRNARAFGSFGLDSQKVWTSNLAEVSFCPHILTAGNAPAECLAPRRLISLQLVIGHRHRCSRDTVSLQSALLRRARSVRETWGLH